MNKDEATLAFAKLEAMRADKNATGDTTTPLFDVRLDAGDDGDYGRDFRIRISEARNGWVAEPAEWIKVMKIAKEGEFQIRLQNDGVELA